MVDPGGFSLPALDASPDTERGMVLLGLGVDRLLAGLGLTAVAVDLAADPGAVTVAVDRAHHGGSAVGTTVDRLVVAGADRWRERRADVARLVGHGSPGGARDALDTLIRVLADQPWAGPARSALTVHLAVCWMRRAEVDAAVADVVGTVAGEARP